MRCAFCLETAPESGFTREHIFPDSIGGTLIVPWVCKDCNDRLGHSVDTTVTEHNLVKLVRFRLGLAGKSGVVPNPFPLATSSADPSQKFLLDFSKPPGESVRSLPSVTRTSVGPGKGLVRVSVDAKERDSLLGIVNKALTRAGAAPVSEADLETENVKTTDPQLTAPFNIDVSHFRRGLLKIVYELARHWLGDEFLDDPIAATMREFIFDKELPLSVSEKYKLRGDIRILPRQPIFPFWSEEKDHLRGSMLTTNSRTCVHLEVLDTMDACVVVTEQPASYAQLANRFISINPATGETRETTFEEEVARITGGSNWQ